MGLLPVAAHPLEEVRRRSGHVSGNGNGRAGLPCCLLEGSVVGYSCHPWYLQLPHCLRRQCFGSHWTLLLASESLHAPFLWSAYPLAPAPDFPLRRPTQPPRGVGVGSPSGSGSSGGPTTHLGPQSMPSLPAERTGTSWYECAAICSSGRYPFTAPTGTDGTHGNSCHRAHKYHIWCT